MLLDDVDFGIPRLASQLAENLPALLEMEQRLSVLALHELDADKQNARQQRHERLRVDMAHLIQQMCNGLVVLPQRERLPVAHVGIWHHASHHAFVQTADGEDGMLDGGLRLADLQHEHTPKGPVEVARQTRCRDMLEELERPHLIGRRPVIKDSQRRMRLVMTAADMPSPSKTARARLAFGTGQIAITPTASLGASDAEGLGFIAFDFANSIRRVGRVSVG